LSDILVNIFCCSFLLYNFIWFVYAFENGLYFTWIKSWFELCMEYFLSSHFILNFCYCINLARKPYVARIINYVLILGELSCLFTYIVQKFYIFRRFFGLQDLESWL
jgi:hypothetical protein